jgi:Fe-S cluster biogenesis protein NfuA
MSEKQLMADAIQAYDKKVYNKAFEIWEKLAGSNIDAMVNLGSLYARGEGVSRDLLKARSWFEKAVQKGHDMAAFYLGGMYENGIGVKQDDEKAISYYEKVASLEGMSSVQVKLGILLQNRDSKVAMQWLIQAAHAGESQAQEMITYVSNKDHAATLNDSFRSLEKNDQSSLVSDVVRTVISPILAKDGGGVELINYLPGTTPEIWLRYLGACSGCHLGSSSTADMIIQALEETIDKNIVVYLW